MKKNIFLLMLSGVIFFSIMGFVNPRDKNIFYSKPNSQTVTNVTSSVTTKFQYFVNTPVTGYYSAPTSTINGHTITLTNYYHSSGTVVTDKWHGQVDGYDVDVVISGNPNVSWQFNSVTVVVP